MSSQEALVLFNIVESFYYDYSQFVMLNSKTKMKNGKKNINIIGCQGIRILPCPTSNCPITNYKPAVEMSWIGFFSFYHPSDDMFDLNICTYRP